MHLNWKGNISKTTIPVIKNYTHWLEGAAACTRSRLVQGENLKVEYIAKLDQKSLSEIIITFSSSKEDLSIYQRRLPESWRELDHVGESYVKVFEDKCATKSSERSRKPLLGQDMPLCNVNGIRFAWQWLIHGVDGSWYRQVWWIVCSPQHHARGSFWSDQADLHQPGGEISALAMPERGDAKPEGGFQCKIRNVWPKQGFAGAEVVDLSVHWLQPTL